MRARGRAARHAAETPARLLAFRGPASPPPHPTRPIPVPAPNLLSRTLDFTGVLWWEVVSAPLKKSAGLKGFSEVVQLESSIKGMCSQSSSLLAAHVLPLLAADGLALPDSCAELFTRDFFARVVGTFEQNAVGVRLRHPIYETLTDGLDCGEVRRRALRFEILLSTPLTCPPPPPTPPARAGVQEGDARRDR